MRALSPRQAQVYTLLLAGATVEHISAELGITVNTARVHIATIYKKISIKARRQLVQVELNAAKLAIRLPQRQLQVLKGILAEKSFLEMAMEMDLSIDTIHRHRYRLYKRLGVTTRAQVTAMVAAHQAGSEETRE